MSDIKPLFLLAGGNPRNAAGTVSSLALALKACDSFAPKVVYLGVASGDNLMFYTAMKSLLHKAGAAEITFPKLARAKADVAAAKRALEAADAVFLTGGEVEDGMRWLTEHGLDEFLTERRGAGKLFFGVAAGSIMMGARWVRWEDPDDDGTAELFDCLGFAGTTFDTHAEDENWKELITALKLEGPGARGYGIPRDGLVTHRPRRPDDGAREALLRYVIKTALFSRKRLIMLDNAKRNPLHRQRVLRLINSQCQALRDFSGAFSG
jgi:peptidase E